MKKFSPYMLFPLIPAVFGTIFVLMLPHNTSKPLLFALGIIVPILWGVCGFFAGKAKIKPLYAILGMNCLTILGTFVTVVLDLVRYFIDKEISLLEDIYFYVGFFSSHFAAALAHLSITFTGIGYNVIYIGAIFLLFAFILGYFTGFAGELSKKEYELYDKINGENK